MQIPAVQPQQPPDVFGIASVNHLSDKLPLIPDAEGECTSLGLSESFLGEPSAFCPDLICHDPEGIHGILLAEPADLA
jgi:hypothetical protein